MKNVYCKNCKHCAYGYFDEPICKLELTIDFYGTKRYGLCENKNKNKDCKDYHKKWWKS